MCNFEFAENYFSFFFTKSHPPSSCSGPVLTCFFHRYMEALRCHWDKWSKENGTELTSQSMYGLILLRFHEITDSKKLEIGCF